jgi:NAD(P)-dependent dehydrogenase (short-subunit alcohol dehydrogenase family)
MQTAKLLTQQLLRLSFKKQMCISCISSPLGVMPTGRIGRPSDIGKTEVFLASDDSSFKLGAELLFDGDMTYLAK